ncbi:MAG: hypothetical protein RL220_1832, partial [Bacteroidota bacterium]
NTGKVSAKFSPTDQKALISILKSRFEKNMSRHKNLSWLDVEAKLLSPKGAMGSLWRMEETGGEPDVVGMDKNSGSFIFMDCSAESPAGRRSLCYDEQAHLERKENKPAGSAMGLAAEMGVQILTEEQYKYLQTLGEFDLKTSSWLATPPSIRKRGGAIFGDRRYDHVFTYHNGVQSYYAARGFRACLHI